MKKNIILLLIIVITFIFLIIQKNQYSVFNSAAYSSAKEFNSTEWKDSWIKFNESNADGVGIYSELSERKKVISSLIKSGILKLKTKDQIIEIIGIEDNIYEENSWQYWISFTPADDKWLKIDFFNNIVSKVSIYED